MVHQRIDIGTLRLRTRPDDAALGLDAVTACAALRLRQVRVGCGCHADRPVDLAGIDFLARFQTGIEILEHAIGLIARMRGTGNDQLVAARRRQHAKTLLDPRQMPVIGAEQFGQQPVVVEGNHEAVGTLHRLAPIRCTQLHPVLSPYRPCDSDVAVMPGPFRARGDARAGCCDSPLRSRHRRASRRDGPARSRYGPTEDRGSARRAAFLPGRGGRTAPA